MEDTNWNHNTSFSQITQAINAEVIEGDSVEVEKFVLETPLIRLKWLDANNRKVWAKLECNQVTNSFKVRGAYNAIRKVSAEKQIVTNSAGNHGLGVAYTLWKMGRKGKVVVPVNASEIKLRRLVNMGVEVIPAGKDLFECAQIARKIANEAGHVYISPYSNVDVIAGQGSIAVEVLQQKSEFDNVLVPLGGGGLVAGVGTYFKSVLKKCKISAMHPKIFGRTFSDDYFGAFSKSVYPTIADGLAVQQSYHDFTANLVKNIVDQMDFLSEDDIETGIVAMLSNEGILVEGAGAIGISALLNDPDGVKYNGDVLVIISGGNIATSSLMHALATQTDNKKYGRLLGFSSLQLPQESLKYAKPDKVLPPSNERSNAKAIMGNELAWQEIVSNLAEDTNKLGYDIDTHVEYATIENLELYEDILEYLKLQIKQLEAFLNSACISTDIWHKRAMYRIALQNFSYLKNSLAWCSASSSQSKRIMFFTPAENNDNAVNYDRYGSLLLKQRELILQRSLGFDTEKTELLLASSGQAAYTIVESFLLRNVMSSHPTVVTCPYIYFENLEQIQAIKSINLVVSDSWELSDLIQLVEKYSAEVLFVDPLANLGTLHTTDFNKFANLLKGHDWSNKWLVVDGTMISGGINLYSIFTEPTHPHILYFESGSKYLQLGLDLQMAGVVVAEKQFASDLNVHRRNTGTVMYQSGVTKFPLYNREQFLSRMLRMTRNAELLRDSLYTLNIESERINVTFPSNWRTLGWKHGGGVVAVTFKNEGLNNRPCLEYLITLIIEECKKHNIPFTKGVSFGFSTTRVSAAAAMAQDRPPFLRFSIGEESDFEMNEICRMILNSFYKFFDEYTQ